MNVVRRAPEQAVRAAAATLVLLEGTEIDLCALFQELDDPMVISRLQRQLGSPSRDDRVRALAATLTSIAIDLDDWKLR